MSKRSSRPRRIRSRTSWTSAKSSGDGDIDVHGAPAPDPVDEAEGVSALENEFSISSSSEKSAMMMSRLISAKSIGRGLDHDSQAWSRPRCNSVVT